MSSPPSFDLLEEPWLRIRERTGEIGERSLRSVLADAHRLRGLAGELPTQDAAVLRLLLAILLGAVRPEFDRTPSEAVELWASWWDAGAVPMDVIDAYLEPLRGRFDLLHPETPFLQVAGLTTASGKRSGLDKVIADLPAGAPFFTTRSGAERSSLSLAEAARWLVHCQAFDPSGIKTGAEGDDRVKGGKGYPLGPPAWAGTLGLVVATGQSLFETLLLNLPLMQSGPDDLPIWERPPLGPGVQEVHVMPQGPADAFTWASRRLRLFIADGRAVDVQVSNGDKLLPANQHAIEPMTAWKWSKTQSSPGHDVVMPVTHDPTKRVWQGLGPLLINGNLNASDRRPAVMEWLATLRDYEAVAGDHAVDLWTVGIEYGGKAATIAGAIDDRLAAPVAALANPVLAQAAVEAATRAKDAVVALVNLVSNLDRAAGGDGNSGREESFERGYTRLDRPYRDWITRLTDPDAVPASLDDWSRHASRILQREADALVREAGPLAIVGRQVTRQGTDKTMLMDAGVASILFRAALKKAFPLPRDEEEVAT